VLNVLVSRWYRLLGPGVVSIAFGVFVPLFSHMTVQALTIVFGVYAFLAGALALALGVRMRGPAGFGSLLCDALASIGAGVAAMLLSMLPLSHAPGVVVRCAHARVACARAGPPDRE
jgi:uncharacterized membrane protein HdeD (DUF308 family)